MRDQAAVVLTGKAAWNAMPPAIFEQVRRAWQAVAEAWNLCPDTVFPHLGYAALAQARPGAPHPKGTLYGMVQWAVDRLQTAVFNFNAGCCLGRGPLLGLLTGGAMYPKWRGGLATPGGRTPP